MPILTTGAGIFGVVAASSFTITNTASPTNTTAGLTFNFPSASIGAADATRIVALVDVARNAVGVSNASGVTYDIGGGPVAMTLVQAGINTTSGTVTCNIWQAAIPTGTTATFVVSYPTSMLRDGISVYSIIGSNGTAPSGAAVQTTNYTTGTGVSMTVTVPSGGGSIVAAANIATAAATPTNYTEDVDKNIGSTLSYETGRDTAHSGSTTYTADWGGNPGSGLGTAAAWSP